jgi:hypothetical protein
MKNLLIVIIIAIIAWFTYSWAKDQKKQNIHDNAIVKYTDGLKSSEEKADEAKDTANLAIVRSAITQFRGSQGRYPDSLQELISKGYVDRVPQGIIYDKETGEAKF